MLDLEVVGLWSASYYTYVRMVTVPYIMVGLERMLDYRGVGLERFHCIIYTYNHTCLVLVNKTQVNEYCMHIVCT